MPATPRVAVVLGTRPEAIKLADLVHLLGARAWVLHTGQHYDAALGDDVLASVGFPPPDEVLDVGGASRGEQIGRATTLLDARFREQRPAGVVVQGDTNATLAGALAANANDVPVVHVEAGIRSHDRAMPEEHNRVSWTTWLSGAARRRRPAWRTSLRRAPLPPRQFLALSAEATVWVSDSGGLQEEASILKRPVVVVRRSTERPEVLGSFAELVGPEGVASAVQRWLDDDRARAQLHELPSPFGDGRASERINAIVTELTGGT